MSNPLYDIRCPECDGRGYHERDVMEHDREGRAYPSHAEPDCECELCQGTGEVTRETARGHERDMCAP